MSTVGLVIIIAGFIALAGYLIATAIMNRSSGQNQPDPQILGDSLHLHHSAGEEPATPNISSVESSIKWQFTPHNLDAWNNSDRRLMFVAPEPNGDQPNAGLDMGAWFRAAVGGNYLNNPQFYRRTRITLSGMMGRDDDSIFDHFRFFNLKATSGTAEANADAVKRYVRENLDEVLDYFLSEDRERGLAPHVAVILGNKAQEPFATQLRRHLVKQYPELLYIYMPSPSGQIGYEALAEASRKINEKLVPITERPWRWSYKSGWSR